jgi:hypothetical protein
MAPVQTSNGTVLTYVILLSLFVVFGAFAVALLVSLVSQNSLMTKAQTYKKAWIRGIKMFLLGRQAS